MVWLLTGKELTLDFVVKKCPQEDKAWLRMIRDSFGVLNEMVIIECLSPEMMTQWRAAQQGLSSQWLRGSTEKPWNQCFWLHCLLSWNMFLRFMDCHEHQCSCVPPVLRNPFSLGLSSSIVPLLGTFPVPYSPKLTCAIYFPSTQSLQSSYPQKSSLTLLRYF